MTTMSPTIVFPALDEVTLEDRPAPTPGGDELLIRTRCSLISTGTELSMLHGQWGWPFPQLPGYSNIGEVVEVGSEVDGAWLGRRVATTGKHTLLHCKQLQHLRCVPDGVSDEQAAFFTLSEIVMNGVRRGQVAWGEAVVVYGAGLLGQLAVRFCRLCGARPVFAVDLADSRLNLLPDDPSIHRINPSTQDLVAAVKAVTHGRMADVVFEVTGNADLIPQAFAPLRRQGRLVMLSSPRGKTLIDLHDLCNAPSYTIIGTHNSSHPPVATPDAPWTQHRHAELFFDLLRDGELDVATLISHDQPYTQALELYRMLVADRSQAMGVILRWC